LDPFDVEARDPQNSNVLFSQLWELEVLESHYVNLLPDLVAKLRTPFKKQDLKLSLDEVLKETYDNLFHVELGKFHRGELKGKEGEKDKRQRRKLANNPSERKKRRLEAKDDDLINNDEEEEDDVDFDSDEFSENGDEKRQPEVNTKESIVHDFEKVEQHLWYESEW